VAGNIQWLDVKSTSARVPQVVTIALRFELRNEKSRAHMYCIVMIKHILRHSRHAEYPTTKRPASRLLELLLGPELRRMATTTLSAVGSTRGQAGIALAADLLVAVVLGGQHLQ